MADIMIVPVKPQHLPLDDLHSSSDQALTSTLSASPYTFLRPSPSLHLAALVLAKRYLDPLASTVSEAQLQRQREARKKRKRGVGGYSNHNGLLQVKEVHLDERFSIDQVWAQAKRVLDATREEVERDLPQILQENKEKHVDRQATKGAVKKDKQLQMVRFDDDGFEVSGTDEDSSEEEDIGSELGEVEPADLENEGQDMEGLEIDGDDAVSEDAEDIEVDEEALDGLDGLDGEVSEVEGPTDTFKEDPNGLNDGFFSIDDFNKQSEFLDRQDAAADINEAASDEEEIDWDADPMATQSMVSQLRSGVNNGKFSLNLDDGAESEDDEGPTFGDVDLNAPEGVSDAAPSDSGGAEDGLNGVDTMQNTNDIHYADFFAPPARKASKAHNSSRLLNAPPLPPARNTQPTNNDDDDEAASDDIQRTISAVRRDIFEDELSAPESDSPAPNTARPLNPNLSTHERRQAQLTEEIRKLEASNVAKREWTLSGEARAADRPLNSLLEEDLDFERTGKPVPVITAAVSEDIESLIKRRIIAREFDELIRRRPDSLTNPNASATRRGKFELEDTKPQTSLAEMYEAEHLRKLDPEGFMDKRDERLKKEHLEIEGLWKDVSAKLDALSSWHYKPKPPQPSVNIVADVPTISMEDARPSTSTDIGGASMLAPQELYRPGEKGMEDGKEGGAEVVLKSGVPVNREEMSREEKLRRRRREKERIKKSGAGKAAGKKEVGKGESERREVLGKLKRGGVKVIGRKGEVRYVEGKEVREQRVGKGAGSFKL